MTRECSYDVELRETKLVITGFVYPAERDVGIMGPYIDISNIVYDDGGAKCDWELTDDEMEDMYEQMFSRRD